MSDIDLENQFRKTWNTRYSISIDGRIRNNRSGRILKQANDGYGYSIVTFSDGPKRQTVRVHQAVAWAFIGKRTAPAINHKDGNKKNNHASNLEYCSHSHNIKHAKRTGLSPMAARTRLSVEDIHEIRRCYSCVPVDILCEAFKLSDNSIRRIGRGEMFRWIKTTNWSPKSYGPSPRLNQHQWSKFYQDCEKEIKGE